MSWYSPPRPQPKVAIPKAPTRRTTHRSPFPSWLPDPNANSAVVHDEPYDDDAETPIQRATSDSIVDRHPTHHGQVWPQNSEPQFLAAQPYTPYTSPAPFPTPSIPEPYSSNINGSYNYNHTPSYIQQQRPASFIEGSSSFNGHSTPVRFPEPELHRSASQRAYHEHQPPHRHSYSDFGPSAGLPRSISYASSFTEEDETPRTSTEELTEELSKVTLESEEGLRKFQAGRLSSKDEEWHRLVPEGARESLGKKEVERQSVFFELFKAERDYVADLEAVEEVFIQPLRSENVVNNPDEFIDSVFSNLSEVLGHHQRMLESLFIRQREQHPLVLSVADIILETVLQFRPAYETYIKHYPIAEARHRAELKQNAAYRAFVEKQSKVSRIKKRDLVTFISRPVTRLPRLSLVLEHIAKLTDPGHPDLESMPLITGIVSELIKSTQPGIEAAESKVKFWMIASNFVFQRGEIIDMDLQSEKRALVISGRLARKQRSELDWHGWNDYVVVLLDNYLVITREDKLSNGDSKYIVVSRPIPLAYLRFGEFDQPPENRKEKSEEKGILDSLRFSYVPQYPFTVYHAAAKSNRRYTLYTGTESARNKWRSAFENTMAVYKAQHDANKWFAPNTINDGMFRFRTIRVSSTTSQVFTGRITAAAVFSRQNKDFVVVGCEDGIYVGVRGDPQYRIVLRHKNPTYICVLPDHNKFLVHVDSMVISYSLDLMTRLSLGASTQHALNASLEKVSGNDTNVVIFRAGIVKDRAIVTYSSKSFTKTTLSALEVVKSPSRHRRQPGELLSYRSFGDPFYVPSKPLDIMPLKKTVAITTEKGVTIVDPTNLASSAILVVPDFTQASADPKVNALRSRCDSGRPLGLARVDLNELLVVYEEFGCFVSRHGTPRRNAHFVRWEIKAATFAHRGDHVLLFSSDFVEIRHSATGRLVQVIEGSNIRLLNTGPLEGLPILMAKTGRKDDNCGMSDELLELIQTTELSSPTVERTDESDQRESSPSQQRLWDEWDM